MAAGERGPGKAAESPEVVVFDATDSEDDARVALAGMMADLGIRSPFVLASEHGHALTRELAARGGRSVLPPDADQRWAARHGIAARRAGADAIVAIGGGRCLDVAKLAAARGGLMVVTVPTQLSHDGLCSPVAVVPNEHGHAQSIGAVMPRAVFLSLPTLLGAPADSVRAGIGDLLANPYALRDWALAAERGLDLIDRTAWELSEASYRLVEPLLHADIDEVRSDKGFVRNLADALVLSGTAMIRAGSSRPASGAEHQISHALDALYGGRALHGAQVGVGWVCSAELYRDDTAALRETLSRLGLPQHPADLGLNGEEVVRILLTAPQTRPGRFTILEEADLDRVTAAKLVHQIWDDVQCVP